MYCLGCGQFEVDPDEPCLGERRCERCCTPKPIDEFPESRADGTPRPFCTPCTNYILWATD